MSQIHRIDPSKEKLQQAVNNLVEENKQLQMKLNKIEQIITETENQHYELQGKKVVMNSLAYGKIREVVENG